MMAIQTQHHPQNTRGTSNTNQPGQHHPNNPNNSHLQQQNQQTRLTGTNQHSQSNGASAVTQTAPPNREYPQRAKSARKSFYQSHKSVATSSAYSPPLSLYLRSKQSTRFDPYEIPPITCCDYLWLIVYYICLYVFFAAFWFSLWLIYKLTTPSDQPRYPHRVRQMTFAMDISANDCILMTRTDEPGIVFDDNLDELASRVLDIE